MKKTRLRNQGINHWNEVEKSKIMENKNDGLHNKYVISKADGSKMDKTAQYFVLRIDLNGAAEDKETLSHRIACRAALREYASRIKETHPQLSLDILAKLIESD